VVKLSRWSLGTDGLRPYGHMFMVMVKSPRT
jgi:hypothetical protein